MSTIAGCFIFPGACVTFAAMQYGISECWFVGGGLLIVGLALIVLLWTQWRSQQKIIRNGGTNGRHRI